MSNRHPELRYEKPEQVIPWAIEQMLKGWVNTAMPGIVDRYDAATKRARVQPALRTIIAPSEGSPDADPPVPPRPRREEDKPTIIDVPVVHPSAGGLIVHLPLRKGDPVVLLFSQRGIAAFKQTFAVSNPTRGNFFDMGDAMALPGFGALNITPASTEGLSVQTEDGDTSIVLTPGNVTIRARQVTIQADRIDDTAY